MLLQAVPEMSSQMILLEVHGSVQAASPRLVLLQMRLQTCPVFEGGSIHDSTCVVAGVGVN